MRVESNKEPARRSASFTKLGGSVSCESLNVDGAKTSGFRLIDLELLTDFLRESAMCKKCMKGELHLEENIQKRSGLASVLEVTCSECDASKTFETSRR